MSGNPFAAERLESLFRPAPTDAPHAGPALFERNMILQTLASVVISIAMTAGIMYATVGADMEGSISLRQIWRVGMAISVIAPALIAPAMGYRIGLLLQKLQNARDQLEDMAKRDALTGLLNRRGVEAAAAEIWLGDPARSGSVGVLMCDIDRFKSINDTYGHDIGDLALIHVARVIRETVSGPGRVLARLGGEEFAVLLQGADIDAGCAVAETLRAACEANPLKLESCVVSVTVSVGGAAQRREAAGLRHLLAEADKALYRAKHEGRNRVCAATPAAPREAEAAEGPARLVAGSGRAEMYAA